MNPLIINNLDFANKQENVTHEIEMDACERLLEMLEADKVTARKIKYTLVGLPSKFHLPGLALRIEAVLPVVCQRCLQGMLLEVSLTHEYVIATSEPEPFDGDENIDWLEASREMDVNALIEDELLMAIPLAPLHQHACKALLKEDVEKPNPFAILKDLIK